MSVQLPSILSIRAAVFLRACLDRQAVPLTSLAASLGIMLKAARRRGEFMRARQC